MKKIILIITTAFAVCFSALAQEGTSIGDQFNKYFEELPLEKVNSDAATPYEIRNVDGKVIYKIYPSYVQGTLQGVTVQATQHTYMQIAKIKFPKFKKGGKTLFPIVPPPAFYDKPSYMYYLVF